MSTGQGSSPQAEAIQKKMDALMTRYLTMKAALLVQSAIDNSMLLCAASGSWMVQLALSLDQVCFQNCSWGGRNRGGGADYAHHINSNPLGFSDFPTALQSVNEAEQNQLLLFAVLM